MSKHSMIVQWSEEDKAYIATVPELPGLSAFGSSQEEASKELSIAREAYLEVLQEDGEEIPEPDALRPFSGQIRLRLPKSLHQSLTTDAKKEGVSLNTHIIQLLSQRNPLVRVSEELTSLRDTVYKALLSPSPPIVPETQATLIIISQLDQWHEGQIL